MRIYKDLNLSSFEAWSGAVNTLERIKSERKCEELELILDDLYPDGMSETELNDLLWFDSDLVYKWLGIRTESEIESEIDDIKEQMEQIIKQYSDGVKGTCKVFNIWIEKYQSDYKRLEEELKELEEELANF